MRISTRRRVAIIAAGLALLAAVAWWRWPARSGDSHIVARDPERRVLRAALRAPTAERDDATGARTDAARAYLGSRPAGVELELTVRRAGERRPILLVVGAADE